MMRSNFGYVKAGGRARGHSFVCLGAKMLKTKNVPCAWKQTEEGYRPSCWAFEQRNAEHIWPEPFPYIYIYILVGAHDLRPLWSPPVSLNLVHELVFFYFLFHLFVARETDRLQHEKCKWGRGNRARAPFSGDASIASMARSGPVYRVGGRYLGWSRGFSRLCDPSTGQ
jgi:hypothetical protein